MNDRLGREQLPGDAPGKSGPSDESTPLLRSVPPEAVSILTTSEATPQDNPYLQRRIALYLALLTAAFEIPLIFLINSETRIFEIIYCSQYYEQNQPSKIGLNGRVPEELCKINAVQSRISTLRGGQQFFQNLPCRPSSFLILSLT